MLKITEELDGKACILVLNGPIDTTTSKDATEAFTDAVKKYDNIVLDFSDVDYISSAGLRAITQLYQKSRIKNGSVVIRNVNDSVMDVFNMTGFTALFSFE